MSWLSSFRQNKEKKKKIFHLLSGLLILIHAYEKWESGHSSYVFFLIFGIIFTLIALLHHHLEKKLPWIDGAFFIIEGILSLIVAYDFLHMGKKALPVCYALVGIFQISLSVVKGRKGIQKHVQSRLPNDTND